LKLLGNGRNGPIYLTTDGLVEKYTTVKQEADFASMLLSGAVQHPIFPVIHDVTYDGKHWIISRENLEDVAQFCCEVHIIWRRLNNSPKKIRNDRASLVEFYCKKPLSCDCHFDILLDLFMRLHSLGITIIDLGKKNWGARTDQLVIRDFGACQIAKVN
jgi:hypothetical protein